MAEGTDKLYEDALEAAQQELATLQTRRAEIDARIARLRETVVSLAYLIGNEAASENLEVAGIGLTDAVAKVLRLAGEAMTPAKVRDELARMGYDINKYTDIIPSIIKVLQRLHAKGHVDIGASPKDGRKLYIWSPIQPSNPIGLSDADALMALAELVGQKEQPTIDAFSGQGSTPKPLKYAEQRRKHVERERKKKE